MESQTVTAHVTLGKCKETVQKTIPAGTTPVSTLKSELGVDATDVLHLHLRHGNEKRGLGDDDSRVGATLIDTKPRAHLRSRVPSSVPAELCSRRDEAHDGGASQEPTR